MSTAVVADAAEINREHQLARMSAESAVQHAMRCGNLLVAAKIEAKHGGWLPWLSANCPEISQRTAQCYMRLHQQLVDPANTQRVAGLSLRRAIDELTESRCAVVAIERGERDAAARGVLYAPVEMPDLGKLAVPDRPEPLHHAASPDLSDESTSANELIVADSQHHIRAAHLDRVKAGIGAYAQEYGWVAAELDLAAWLRDVADAVPR